jgi:hypothetical protein
MLRPVYMCVGSCGYQEDCGSWWSAVRRVYSADGSVPMMCMSRCSADHCAERLALGGNGRHAGASVPNISVHHLLVLQMAHGTTGIGCGSERVYMCSTGQCAGDFNVGGSVSSQEPSRVANISVHHPLAHCACLRARNVYVLATSLPKPVGWFVNDRRRLMLCWHKPMTDVATKRCRARCSTLKVLHAALCQCGTWYFIHGGGLQRMRVESLVIGTLKGNKYPFIIRQPHAICVRTRQTRAEVGPEQQHAAGSVLCKLVCGTLADEVWYKLR